MKPSATPLRCFSVPLFLSFPHQRVGKPRDTAKGCGTPNKVISTQGMASRMLCKEEGLKEVILS